MNNNIISKYLIIGKINKILTEYFRIQNLLETLDNKFVLQVFEIVFNGSQLLIFADTIDVTFPGFM